MKAKLLIVLFLLVTCSLGAQKKMPVQKAKHVVLIGSDGFSSHMLENGGLQNYPNIKALMEQGSYTLRMRSVLPSSSAVNWKSMIGGAGPELHGYTQWGSQTPELPSRVINDWGIFPTIVGELADQKPGASICAGYTWAGIGFLFEQKACSVVYPTQTDRQLTDSIVSYFTTHRPQLTFVSFAEPDGAGHGIGWGTPQYIEECKTIDGYVGEIVDCVRKSVGDDAIIIFTADHGGKGKGHGGKTMEEMEIPFVIAGKGIKKNYQIQGSSMIYDCAATMAYILNLQAPQVWVGRPIAESFSAK